jgi:hypothetical protein
MASTSVIPFPGKSHRKTMWCNPLRRGDELPPNVHWLPSRPQQKLELEKSPELLLGLLILNTLSLEQRLQVRSRIFTLALKGEEDALALTPLAEVL